MQQLVSESKASRKIQSSQSPVERMMAQLLDLKLEECNLYNFWSILLQMKLFVFANLISLNEINLITIGVEFYLSIIDPYDHYAACWVTLNNDYFLIYMHFLGENLPVDNQTL